MTKRFHRTDSRLYDRLQRRADTIASALQNSFRLSEHQVRNLRTELRGIRRKQIRCAVAA